MRMIKLASLAIMMIGMGILSTSAIAGSHNPCNPCAANPCAMKQNTNPCSTNPCAMKKSANPCAMNPCSMPKKANPCADNNPCSMNPCSTSQRAPIRAKAFKSFGEASSMGKKMWNDENLGTTGLSCASCHTDYELLNLGKNQNYPHYVEIVGDVVTLDQMINFCMINPMKAKQFDKNSKELTALAAYFRAYRMEYMKENRK